MPIDISVWKHAWHKQQEKARLHPLLSYKSSQKKHSKDSIISSLVWTFIIVKSEHALSQWHWMQAQE